MTHQPALVRVTHLLLIIIRLTERCRKDKEWA